MTGESFTITWGGIVDRSSALVWQLCAASLGIRGIANPIEAKEFLSSAMWRSKDAMFGRFYSVERIAESKEFCERAELAASNIGSGNLFAMVEVEAFCALAKAAGWTLPEYFYQPDRPPEIAEQFASSMPDVDMEIRRELERLRHELAMTQSELEDARRTERSLRLTADRLYADLHRADKRRQRLVKISNGRLQRLKALRAPG